VLIYMLILSSSKDPVALFILACSDGHGNIQLTGDEKDGPTEVGLVPITNFY
jgi:hypothetical protein